MQFYEKFEIRVDFELSKVLLKRTYEMRKNKVAKAMQYTQLYTKREEEANAP